MRISDWSSDLCSSDLISENLSKPVTSLRRAFRKISYGVAPGIPMLRNLFHLTIPCQHMARKQLLYPVHSRLDRQSVVYGKSVSVRVDLGSSRVLQKKLN